MFITFEGGEGSGKSTLIEKLGLYLKDRGDNVVITREPGGSKLGDQIRNWLLYRDVSVSVGHRAELLLFLAGRAQHIEEVIRPALAAGKIVLCDRFNDSTVAYQGGARGMGEEPVRQMCDIVCEGLKPDLTFFLDVDPEVGLNRTAKLDKENASSGELDRIESEKMDFHRRVRQGFHDIAKREPERFHILDTSISEDQVFTEALKALEALA